MPCSGGRGGAVRCPGPCLVPLGCKITAAVAIKMQKASLTVVCLVQVVLVLAWCIPPHLCDEETLTRKRTPGRGQCHVFCHSESAVAPKATPRHGDWCAVPGAVVRSESPEVPHQLEVPASESHAVLSALLASRTAGATDPPGLSRALVSEWAVLRQAGMCQWEAALQLAQRACAADPTYPAAWSALGFTQVKLG